MLNLLVSSNRYGYIFYATEIDGLAIIPSSYIDQESRYLSVTSEDDDDDNNTDENQQLGKTPIIYRSYLPDQKLNKNPSFIPYWLSLNSDETILAIILCKLDTHSCLIILYDVVKLIQTVMRKIQSFFLFLNLYFSRIPHQFVHLYLYPRMLLVVLYKIFNGIQLFQIYLLILMDLDQYQHLKLI
jgi:hypothetical protein